MIIAVSIFLGTVNLLQQNAEYQLIDSLRHYQNAVTYEIEEIETRLRFYGRFMADIDRLSDQFSDTKVKRSIIVYTINFLHSHNKYPYLPKSSPPNEAYTSLIQKGLLGLNSIDLIEHDDQKTLSLSIDSVSPIETPAGISETVIISYPLNKKFLDGLRARTGGADISLVYKNQIILSSIASASLYQASLDKLKDILPENLLNRDSTLVTEWGAGEEKQKVLFFPLTVNYKKQALFAISLPLKELAGIRQNIYTYAGGLAFLILASAILMYFFILRRFAYPLELLSMTAEQIAPHSGGRVGNLQHSFDAMAENVQRMTDSLRHSNEEMMEWNNALEKKVEEQSHKLQEVQQQLSRAEKLSALGELVSGIAHEMNNPLSTIIGFAQIIEMESDNDKFKSDLGKIVHEAKRAGKIVKNLLAYARKSEISRQPTQINSLIARVIDLRSYEWQVSNIEVVQELDPDLKITMVDPNRIEQVLVNIMNNAEHAILETGRKGQIKVSSHQNDGRIIIKISDNGAGIPKGNLSKIFDPFFTTKKVGQGTGLGLSVSYGIIEEHGGSIQVETELGKGSTFIITLPVVAAYLPSDLSNTKPETGGQSLSGTKVLIVDDEQGVLDFITRFLESAGCITDMASNGLEALNKLQKSNFDVIICDVKMPVMDGKSFYARLCAEMPHLTERTIFATGDLMGKDTVYFIESTRAKYVSKPFDLIQLEKVICEIISQVNRK